MEFIVDVVLIVVFAIYWIKSTMLDRRIVKIGKELIKQNELLEKRCGLLETIFHKEYEEVKKKYSIDRKEQQ